jgi:hypothetical protein
MASDKSKAVEQTEQPKKIGSGVIVDRRLLVEVLRDLPHTNVIAGVFQRLLEESDVDFDAMRQRAEKAELWAEQLHAIACDLRRHATCENMGHGRLDFHGLGDPCKVLERIDAALAQQA